MLHLAQTIGFTAASFTSTAFLPQSIKTIMTRKTLGLSLVALLLQFTGNSLWIIYGVSVGALPIILANVITSVTVFTIIITVIVCRTRSRGEV